jgi:hypothetical protein
MLFSSKDGCRKWLLIAYRKMIPYVIYTRAFESGPDSRGPIYRALALFDVADRNPRAASTAGC